MKKEDLLKTIGFTEDFLKKLEESSSMDKRVVDIKPIKVDEFKHTQHDSASLEYQGRVNS